MRDITFLKKIDLLIEKNGQEGGFFLKSKAAWISLLPSTKTLKTFFEQYGPKQGTSVELGSSVLYFISLEELTKSQVGYRSYENGSPVQNWNQEYVVIGLYNDEPVIVNTRNEQTEVLVAYESGVPKMITNSLEEFFEAIYSVLSIQYSTFNFEIMDEENFEYRAEFMDEIEASLKSILSSPHRKNFIDFFYG
ncbi:hypothetical protein [Shewanella woodyi]|uniref:hypothetical protein n=1 Tax=Shewanella woodyi TaxID=60961 RepID=UPI0007EA9C09|nr:hypothetical protein [Shewanella woodyi]